jgi:transcriptional regulator with XRE-family HTH domain
MTIGQKIKKIRKLRGLTQTELGEKIGFVGMSADVRIAQYESGTRTPKAGLIIKMAKVLKVSPSAIAEPDLDTHVGVMQALFAFEDAYGAKIDEIDGKLCLVFDEGRVASEDYVFDSARRSLYDLLRSWRREASRVERGESSLDEYNEWRFNYPESEAKRNKKILRERREKRKEEK